MAERLRRIAEGARRDVSHLETLVQAIPNDDRSALHVRVVRFVSETCTLVVRLVSETAAAIETAPAALVAYLVSRDFPLRASWARTTVGTEMWADGVWLADCFVALHVVEVVSAPQTLLRSVLETVHRNSVERFLDDAESVSAMRTVAAPLAVVQASTAELVRAGTVLLRNQEATSVSFARAHARWTSCFGACACALTPSFERVWGAEVVRVVRQPPYPRHVAVHADADTARTLSLLVSASGPDGVPPRVRVVWDAHFVDASEEEEDEFDGVTLWVGNAHVARQWHLCSPLTLLPARNVPVMAPSPHKKIVEGEFAASGTVVCSATPWQLRATDVSVATLGVSADDETARVLTPSELVWWCARHPSRRPRAVRFVAQRGANVRALDVVAAHECATEELQLVNVSLPLVRAALRGSGATTQKQKE